MAGPNVRYHSFVADNARWNGFELRDGDIVISTPPKCGTTWMQMLVASLVLPDGLDRPLTRISPWLEMLTAPLDEVRDALAAQQHRRLIKSHTPFDGLPVDERLVYICVGRDPRDVALSWDNHRRNMDLDTFVKARFDAVGADDLAELGAGAAASPMPEDPMERFWGWVDDDAPHSAPTASLAHTMYHLSSFWAERHRPNVHLVHYGDLVADLAAEVRRLAAFLAIEVDERRVDEVVTAGAFETMKANASVLAPGAPDGHWQSDSQFFDKGPLRRWHDVLDDADVQRYEARVSRLSDDDDFLAWLHGGRAGGAHVVSP